MRILVDLTYIGEDVRSGIDTYSIRLIRGWIDSAETNKQHFSFIVTTNNVHSIRNIYPELDYIILNMCSLCYFSKLSTLINRCRWHKLVNNSNADRVFVPFPTILSSGKVKIRKIVTIHDLQAMKIYKGIKKMQQWWILKQAILTSDKIIAISNYTKKDIYKYCKKVDFNKVRVIYNSVIVAPKALSIDETLTPNYILYVNSLTELKNIKTLLLAFNELKSFITNDLLIVGKKTSYWVAEIVPLIKQLGIQDRVIHISRYLSDEELSLLYKKAIVFVSPSQHEGFGYTSIEAAICGTPVICTEAAALPEVTMGLVNYYTFPLNYMQLKDKIMEILKNKPSQELLKNISCTFQKRYDNIQQSKCVCAYLVEDMCEEF